MGILCTWVTLLTDLQILGCELHKNSFGGRALPGPAGGAIALPQAPSRCKGKWRGNERVGNRKREEGNGREGCEGVGKDWGRVREGRSGRGKW